ncbi:MAG TPA: 23S rRNA (guanosine(2251)-2'-O)-methyltransferase RlmB [Burkholderiales bacterium]|nr:23S rRNA (guanosine(2251)-2'-O)-methyltransferase RlmB [Burkholderiales bacterium]
MFGFHAVRSCIRQNPAGVATLYVQAGRDDVRMRDLVATAGQAGLRVLTVERERLDRLAGHTRHQGVVASVLASDHRPDLGDILGALTEPALLLVLDGVQDPHNLGACLRVADGLGAHAVIVPKDRSVGLTPTVAKVACGASETVPYVAVTNLARTLRALQEQGVWIVGADAAGTANLGDGDLDLRGALAWVLGAEGEGLRRLTRETCDALVRIPMIGTVESLNVSVAAGICLYESRRQRPASAGVP